MIDYILGGIIIVPTLWILYRFIQKRMRGEGCNCSTCHHACKNRVGAAHTPAGYACKPFLKKGEKNFK